MVDEKIDFTPEELDYFDKVQKGIESLHNMNEQTRVRYDAWMQANGLVITTVNRSSGNAKPQTTEHRDVVNEYEMTKCKIPITDLTEEEMSMFFVGYYPIKYSAPDINGKREKIQDTKKWLEFRPNFEPSEDHEYLGWSQRNYLLTWNEAKQCDGFNGVVKEGIVIIDFDKHSEPEYSSNPLIDTKMFARVVKFKHLNCLIVKTNNGLHAYFKNDGQDIKSNVGMYTPLNIKCDYRANGSASVCLKINGEARTVIFKPSPTKNEPIKIDEIPVYLKPCSKSPILNINYVFSLHLEDLKDREVTFRNYILRLINYGYSDKEITDIILAINSALTHPLLERELFDKLLGKGKLKESRKKANQPSEEESKPEKLVKKGQTLFKSTSAQGECENEICRAVKLFNSIHTNKKFVGVKKNRGVYEIIIGDDGNYHEFPLTPASLSSVVTTNEFFWSTGKVNDKLELEYAPPTQVAFRGIIESQGFNCDLPIYKRVFNGAFITEDGRIVNKRGLDEETGVYLLNDVEIPEIPEHPTWEQVEEVRKTFADIFRDFQFEETDDCPEGKLECNPNYNNLILVLVLAVFRMSYNCAYPIACINKSSERSGASLLCSVISRMAHNAEVQSVSLSEDNVQEAEKQINSVLIESNPISVLDNVTNRTKTNYSTLLSVTSGDGTMRIRPLGSSAMIEVDKSIFIFMNGIKINVSADLCARVIQITLALKSSWQKASFSRTKMELLDMASSLHAYTIYGVGVFYNYWKSMGSPNMPSVGINISEYLNLYQKIGGILYTCGYKKILSNSIEVATSENEKENNGARFIDIFYKKFKTDPVTIDKIMAVCLNERLIRNQTAIDSGSVGSRQNYKYSDDLVTLLFSPKEIQSLEGIDSSVVGRRLGKYTTIVFNNVDYVLKKGRNREGTYYQLIDVNKLEISDNETVARKPHGLPWG